MTQSLVELKEEGNKEFKSGQYLKAAASYTKALKQSKEKGDTEPEQVAILYSNRSAALLKLSKLGKALTDAESAVQLRPDWEKGHYRLGASLEAQGNLEEALKAFSACLKLNPDSLAADRISAINKQLNKQKQTEQRQAARQVSESKQQTTSK